MIWKVSEGINRSLKAPYLYEDLRRSFIIIILMPRSSKKQASNEPHCTICMERSANCSLDGCSHQFCLRCIRKWATTKNSCPLCRERIRVLKCKNNVYEVRAVPERTRVHRPPAPSPLIQQRRIVILPVVMYPQPGCFFYTQPSSLFLGAPISSLSGLNYPLGAPSFFIPSSL